MAPSGISPGIHDRKAADKNRRAHIMHELHAHRCARAIRIRQIMTNSDESDMKMEYVLRPDSPKTSGEIQYVFFSYGHNIIRLSSG